MKTPFVLFLLPVSCILLALSNPARQFAAPNKTDSFSLNNGKTVFEKNCTGCHGSSGQGSFGPNLCDNYWIHGAHYHNILHVIRHGSKGMSSFKHKLSHAQLRDVAHYVMLTLKGSNPKNAKAPEGKKHGS